MRFYESKTHLLQVKVRLCVLPALFFPFYAHRTALSPKQSSVNVFGEKRRMDVARCVLSMTSLLLSPYLSIASLLFGRHNPSPYWRLTNLLSSFDEHHMLGFL
jgi:hypothetical protein